MKFIILTVAFIISTISVFSQSTPERKNLKLTAIPINKKAETIDLKTFNPKKEVKETKGIVSDDKVLVKPKEIKVKKNNTKNASL